jgi:hypothetical protein
LEYPPIDVVVTQFRAHVYIQVPANVYHQNRGSQFERKSVGYPTKPEEPMPLIISICGLSFQVSCVNHSSDKFNSGGDPKLRFRLPDSRLGVDSATQSCCSETRRGIRDFT